MPFHSRGVRRLAAAVGLMLAAAGCSTATEPVQTTIPVTVRITASIAVRGSAVPLLFINQVGQTWIVSPCPIELQRQVGTRWVAQDLPECAAPPLDLSGGEPVSAQFSMPATARGGVYRLVYSAWEYIPGIPVYQPRPRWVESNTFWVPPV